MEIMKPCVIFCPYVLTEVAAGGEKSLIYCTTSDVSGHDFVYVVVYYAIDGSFWMVVIIGTKYM